MHPLSLKGHDRALTRVRINRDGDLLFSSGKDKSSSVWYMENGERIGTYDGHNGVIWDLDVSWDTKHLCSASGDDSIKVSYYHYSLSFFVFLILFHVSFKNHLFYLASFEILFFIHF